MLWRRALIVLLLILLAPQPGGALQPSSLSPGPLARAIRAAEYILRCAERDGAIRDAHDNPAINMDNNMGYALTALVATYQATGEPRYLEAVRHGLVWLASVQDEDGGWHWGYLAPQGRPFVGGFYRGLGITDIKGVDAIQAYFAYNLYLHVRLSGDEAFGRSMLPAARRGIDYLIARNYDGRFFFSSWQQRGGRWLLLREQFAAGQGDVYLGLMALWRLTGERRYEEMAVRLAADLPAFLHADAWATSRRRSAPYRFSNGYLPYVFRVPEGLAWLTTHQDGTAIAAGALAIGRQANGLAADDALTMLGSLQGPHGGVAFSPEYETYYYTNDAAFAILSWLGSPFAGLAASPGPSR